MRLASLVLAGTVAMTACSESGSGTVVSTFSRLPVSSGYAVGFAADGTPLLGFTTTPGPIARAEGPDWVAVTQSMFLAVAFGSDNDGTPLVAYRTPTQSIQVAQLVGDQLVDLADTPLSVTPSALLQHVDGSRYAISGGFAMRLAPGSRTWTNSTIQMFSAARGPDGALLAWTPSTQGLVRVGPNDTSTPVVSCATLGPNVCGGGLFGGVDAAGRFYFASFDGVTVFDPSTPAMPTSTITLPQGEQPVNLIATAELALLATFGSTQSLYALPRGAVRAAPVRTDQVLTGQGVALHADLDGSIYVSQGDWLGLAATIGGD